MHSFDEEAIMKSEDGLITNLLSLSGSTSDASTCSQFLFCTSCSKLKLPNGQMKDFRRWTSEANVDTVFENTRSYCNCKYELEVPTRNESFKQKKKNTNMMDATKSGRNHSTSGKDFIAHNKLLCNASRVRANSQNQRMYHFNHLKNSAAYMEQYRSYKLDKIEQSCYQLDESSLDNELFSSLSNSLSTLMTNGAPDSQAPFNFAQSLAHYSQNQSKINTQKSLPSSSPSNSAYLNSLSIGEPSKSDASNASNATDNCIKCGDTLMKREFVGNLSQSVRQDTSFLIK